jgi:hypothetical protein
MDYLPCVSLLMIWEKLEEILFFATTHLRRIQRRHEACEHFHQEAGSLRILALDRPQNGHDPESPLVPATPRTLPALHRVAQATRAMCDMRTTKQL